MKKLAITLWSLFVVIAVKADEGMWMIYNLPTQVYEQMKSEGLKIPYDQLYNSKNAIKNAVVNFSGYCTGVVVSPDGLVLTNHHCGFEAIRNHSTVDHDYLKDGFYAKTYADELPNKNMFVSFMISQEDVTSRLFKMGLDTLISNEKRGTLIDSLIKIVNDSIKLKDSTLHVDIDRFYEGNKYYMTTYRDFTDIRLVFAPTKSLGKFGGDTDNWVWPRQTCDFSVFRIYADPKTNGPAEYSKDNVPYHPANYAQVSLQGYKDGDYAMTMGYPGRTERYLSSYGIEEMRDAKNIPRIQMRSIKQAIMKRFMNKDQNIRIKYDSKYAESSNYWKNSIGMNRCIDSLNIIPQKQLFEKQVLTYVDSTGFLKDSLDFGFLKNLYAKRYETIKALTYFYEAFRNGSFLAQKAYKLNHSTEVDEKNKVEIKDEGEYDLNVDKALFVSMLGHYTNNVKPQYLPDFYKIINKKFDGDYNKYANYMYNYSIILKFGKKYNTDSRRYKKDCGIRFGLDLMDLETSLREEIRKINDSIDTQERYLCKAILRMEEDQPHYSDANFTMRLSYGTVGGYTVKGNRSSYYTTPASILKKMAQGDKNADYFAEPEIKSLIGQGDFAEYRDKTTNDLNLCFLTNNDITGGNSGSPMFDGNGKLIGLAFDGNWESLSSDIFFDKRLARCIGVDIRYVLYIMDKWGHADRLIREINAK